MSPRAQTAAARRVRGRPDDEEAGPSGPVEGVQQAPSRSAPPDEKQLFSCKRRKRGEPARCRVPSCDVELPSQFHEKYRICPRHYTAPSVHVAGEAWRFCQQCAKFHTLAEFTDDRRSCNKSLTSHNRRRRGVPRSAPRAAGDSSSGGSGGRRARRTARGTARTTPAGTTEAAAANGIDTGSSGSIRGGEGASPHATAGTGGATPPASASAAAPEEHGAEGSKSSATPPRNGYVSSPAGSGSLAHEAPRHNSAPPAACAPLPADQPFLPVIAEQSGLPWPPPPPVDRAASAPATMPAGTLPPLPSLGLPWQGPAGAALQAQDEEGRNFDSVLMGLLLADSPRANGEARQQHAHAALLDAYGSLLEQPDSTVPSCQELLDIADELGIFADHLADPTLPASDLAPEQAQQAQHVQQGQPLALSGGTPTSAAATVAPHSVQPADALAGAAGRSSSTATASSSATAALMPRFPGLPGDTSAAVTAALQAAQAAGVPALPPWQQAQQAAQQGGKQTRDASALAEQYTSLDRMERLSFKIFGCHPSELAPDVHNELSQMVQASIAALSQPQMQGFVRPGCTFLTVDLRVERLEEAGAGPAAPVHGGSGGGSDAGEGPSQGPQHASSKQLDDMPPGQEAGGTAGNNGGHAAALLHSLTAQALLRRSMGVAASASPLLAQLNTQQMVAAAGGRLVRSMPLPAAAPAQAANATPAPQLPRLAAISPACLVLPPAGPSPPEPPVIVLTGHGLFAHTGRPCLVLARQHGRHLPVEVWGGSDGGAASPGALVVSVTGLRPGVCELEVQRGSVLGSSRPLLVLPAGMEGPAAELGALASSGGGGGAAGGSASIGPDAFLRDVGAVVAWVELRSQQAGAPAGPAAFYSGSEDSLGSGLGSESGSESEAEEEQEEEWEAASQHADGREGSVAEALVAPPPVLPLLPAAHVARLAHHAACFALRCGWEATAAALESAAAAAAEAAAAPAAVAPPAPALAPGWVPGSATLQRDEHALGFEFWAPLWQLQLQQEGQAAPAAPLTAWWQPAAGTAAAEAQQRAVPEERYWVAEDDLKGQGGAARSGLAGWKAAAAVAAVLSTAAALLALCWG